MTEAQTMLEPCPWCNKPLYVKRGQINPYARCMTEDCFGRKMPVVSLDVPADVESWNTRATAAAQPVAWRYKCADGSVVLMLKPLTDEQKRRGYYTGEDGEDEVDGDEPIVGPFHWAEETPLYASPPRRAGGEETMARRIELARAFIAAEYADPAQEPKGDWIAPEARPAHDALCLCLEALGVSSVSRPDRATEGFANPPAQRQDAAR